MADQRSIEMLAFKFASRTFAYLRLGQVLSRSLSAFSSFLREYLDKVITADQCAQYVNDIGIAANDTDHLIANLRATFKCIQEAGLKLTWRKCPFGATEIDFRGRRITPQGVEPQKQKKTVTRFFQTKIVPPALWNACDYVIQFNFVIAHIPGAQNTAADYLSRLEADPKDKLVMKIREDVQILPIEMKCPICRSVTGRKNVLHQ